MLSAGSCLSCFLHTLQAAAPWGAVRQDPRKPGGLLTPLLPYLTSTALLPAVAGEDKSTVDRVLTQVATPEQRVPGNGGAVFWQSPEAPCDTGASPLLAPGSPC